MKKIKISLSLFLLFIIQSVQAEPISKQEIELCKSKFFIFQSLGIDSTLIYIDKLFLSNKPIDQVFALTAKMYLHTKGNIPLNEVIYEEKIKSYLDKVPVNEYNYRELGIIYNIRGATYIEKNAYDLALEHFLKAEEMSRKAKDMMTLIKVKANKGFIKSANGLEGDAIRELKDVLLLYQQNKALYPIESYSYAINNTLNTIGNSYLKLFYELSESILLDSSLLYYNKSLNGQEDEISKAYTYMSIGSVLQEKKEYNKALENYNKSLETFKRNNYISECSQNQFYIGTLYFNNKQYEKSKITLLSLKDALLKDSITADYYFSTLRYLSLNYSNLGKMDSAYYYANISNVIFEKKTKEDKKKYKKMYSLLSQYDFQKMAGDLEQEKNTKQLIKYAAILMVLILLLIIGVMIYKKRKEAEAYKKIIENYKHSKQDQIPKQKSTESKISNEQEDKILKDLQTLEYKLYFLKPEFNQYNVAKKINTNTTYLSQIILNHKNLTFTEYTNSLRIDYLINELMVNHKLRAYTMQALAEQIGYKNGTSFSKIFKSKMGISPYQFIEKLKKEKN